MVFFIGVVGAALIFALIIYKETMDRKIDESKVRDKILEYLKGKDSVSIIELIEHINVMPDKAFNIMRKREGVDLISEKNGKMKITKFGEKAYENILKGE